MTVILGPAVCKVCRALVFWADVRYGPTPGHAWRDENGRIHHCAKA